MSRPNDLQLRQWNVCLECSNRVGLSCRRRNTPIKWNINRYGCGDYTRRDYQEADE